MKIGLHEEMCPIEKHDSEITCQENEFHWMELALYDPLFEVSYIRASGTHLYSVDISELSPSKEGVRNLDFEIVYPLYTTLKEIIEAGKTTKTAEVKIIASSREHWEVTYTEEFPLDQWSYTRMNNIMDGLADQLTMKQNLNGGLLVQLTFNE